MPIVSEHEQAIKEPEISEQPSAETSLVKKINEMYAKSKRARVIVDKEWNENYDFFNGKQWPVERPRWRFSESINVTFSNIMQEIAIQTDSRPKTDFLAQEPTDEAFAEILREVNDANWQKYNWNMTVGDTLLDSKIYDAGHVEVKWNPELEDGLGDIEYDVLAPQHCFPDPVHPFKRWFLHVKPRPTGELRTLYPDKADKIKPDISNAIGAKDREEENTPQTFRDPDDAGRPDSISSTQRFGGEEMTLLFRVWMQDDTLEELEAEKDDGTKEFIKKKVFPQGRYVEMANNVILVDGPNGVEIDGKIVPYRDGEFPLAKLVNYSYPREYWGKNEVSVMKGPQKIVNQSWSHLLDKMKMSSNPKTIVGANSGIDPDLLTNEPAIVIETNDMNAIRFEPGTPIDAGMFNTVNTSLEMVDRVQGIQEASRGAPQPGITSGLQLEGFVEASQTRIRLKNRNLDAFLQILGQLSLSRYMQFYTVPRTFRITNKQGFPEFIEFFISEGEEGPVANLTQKSSGETATIPIKGTMDVKVAAGSSLPFAKAQKTATALNLRSSGDITRLSMLKSIDWPNAEEEDRKVQEEQAALQQQQLQQGVQ